MKTIKVIPICIALVVMISGCEIVGPKIKIEEPKVKIPAVVVEGSSEHCPPGQAKKGRC